jgi:two-component system, chemotaxis family, sensor kinase Cph1
MSEVKAPAIDKADCEREPIHIPGAIQPHGYLFVLDATNYAVVAVSRNAAAAFDLSPADMLGRPVSDFLASSLLHPLDEMLALRDRAPPFCVAMRTPSRSYDLDGVIRAGDGVILLELEVGASAEWALRLFGQVRSAIERIRHSPSKEAACQALTEEVRRLCGFERVMAYRFDDDWNGLVVAEDRAAGAQSYLGHAFPASDIPPQARALYLRNTVRIIPNAGYQLSPIVPSVHPATGQPFDLSDVTLRSVSPIHLEYLANMGVMASMSVSIVLDNRLWGLVACHHDSPRTVPQSVLQSCDLLAQTTAWCLESIERAAAAVSLAAVRRLYPDLERDEHPDFRDRLAVIGTSLLAATRSHGVAIWKPEGVWGMGLRPSNRQLEALAAWLRHNGQDHVTTDRLSELYPADGLVALASGMVAARLGAGWLFWFRGEWPHSLTWAGRPNGATRDAGTGRINPRKSFASWRQKVRGRSEPWTVADLSAADEAETLVLRAIMSDNVRQLVESEQALREAKRFAEAATRAKSQFLAQMSHEIRTPLNGVLGMAQVMGSEALSNQQRDRLGVIQKSGAGLLTVLNDILDLSKIEAGQLDLEDVLFDIKEVAADAFDVFQSIAAAKGISLVLDISDEAQGAWRGDPVRLRQVISNLVSNALKFTSEGEVHVTVDAPFRSGAKILTIAVADTGIGVPAEALPRLFEPFVQADSTTTRRFGGTGLGLTICRDIAERMGGGISVRSVVGKGTVFDVSLPLVWEGAIEQRSEAGPVETEEQADVSSLRILAAEDNETNQVVLKAVLGSLGVSVTIVDNGRRAVDAWASGQFDLVLMDVEMPVLDGVHATSEIRRIEAECGQQRTPVIAFSANAMKHQVAEYLAAGFDGYLAKPVVVTELYAVLSSAVATKNRGLVPRRRRGRSRNANRVSAMATL